jgi:hypothetical protein
MRHTISTTGIFSSPILLPIGCFDQFFIGTGISIGHEIAWSLPAQYRVARDTPGGTGKVNLALQEIQEEGRVV